MYIGYILFLMALFPPPLLFFASGKRFGVLLLFASSIAASDHTFSSSDRPLQAGSCFLRVLRIRCGGIFCKLPPPRRFVMLEVGFAPSLFFCCSSQHMSEIALDTSPSRSSIRGVAPASTRSISKPEQSTWSGQAKGNMMFTKMRVPPCQAPSQSLPRKDADPHSHQSRRKSVVNERTHALEYNALAKGHPHFWAPH